jgi:hypothetical protein
MGCVSLVKLLRGRALLHLKYILVDGGGLQGQRQLRGMKTSALLLGPLAFSQKTWSARSESAFFVLL